MRHEAVVATETVLDRRARLLMWAGMIRSYKGPVLQLYHNLENYAPADLRQIMINRTDQTAFALAVSNPALGISGPLSVASFMDKMELTQAQLHEFSCDCGGSISNDDMARRIEKLAG